VVGSAWWMWLGVAGAVALFLVLDLALFHRDPDEVRTRDAVAWSVVWLVLGLGFAGVVWWLQDSVAAKEYVTGYVIERSLSLDNLFVLAVLLGYFAVPGAYRHRALLWGIVAALVLRTAFIAAGAVALERVSWMAYVLGAFLVLTGVRLARRTIEVHPGRNRVVGLVRRVVPMTAGYHGQRLVVRVAGRRRATPMVVVLVAVATTDVAFATDSIPAIYAVTDDPFLVFAANAFSVLGMLALYFLLADLIVRFRYLRSALAAILVFVGAKMAAADLVPVPITVSLAVVAGILVCAVVASLAVSDRPVRQEWEATPRPRPRRNGAEAIHS
jgi:TerC family integral membrane protein